MQLKYLVPDMEQTFKGVFEIIGIGELEVVETSFAKKKVYQTYTIASFSDNTVGDISLYVSSKRAFTNNQVEGKKIELVNPKICFSQRRVAGKKFPFEYYMVADDIKLV